jgi:bifunctional DNA-binding transcriptional regulator/antitoxin component of YhaV-PrlF toxin-antitoxin module
MAERITIPLQDEGMLILPPELRTRLGLKTGDLLDVSELNGTILLSPRRMREQISPDPVVDDPQFQSKLKSIQDMLENL